MAVKSCICSFRLESEFVAALKLLAHERSLAGKVNLSYADLIRLAVLDAYKGELSRYMTKEGGK